MSEPEGRAMPQTTVPLWPKHVLGSARSWESRLAVPLTVPFCVSSGNHGELRRRFILSGEHRVRTGRSPEQGESFQLRTLSLSLLLQSLFTNLSPLPSGHSTTKKRTGSDSSCRLLGAPFQFPLLLPPQGCLLIPCSTQFSDCLMHH